MPSESATNTEDNGSKEKQEPWFDLTPEEYVYIYKIGAPLVDTFDLEGAIGQLKNGSPEELYRLILKGRERIPQRRYDFEMVMPLINALPLDIRRHFQAYVIRNILNKSRIIEDKSGKINPIKIFAGVVNDEDDPLLWFQETAMLPKQEVAQEIRRIIKKNIFIESDKEQLNEL